jgi:hypothetical protein
MRRFSYLCALLLALACASPAAERRLDFRDIGIYGTLYDFCTFSVYKLSSTDDPARLERYGRMIHDAHEAGKFTLVGLYTFDRVTYKEPLEAYFRQTDHVLDALDLSEVDALFLSEENVTWNNGLAVLNQLYDHVKSRYGGPVYQWYTMPDVPHPKQKADGWIIDPYGFRYTEFRRYLMKYLVQGKPVIACLNASEDVAPWESSQDQVMACREFNIPIFYYAVDRELGAPNIWRSSDEPGLAGWRGWVYRVREMAQKTDVSRLPEASAQFSPGRPVEIAGDLSGNVAYEETFDSVRFMDDATIDGFLELRWSGEDETLSVVSDASQPALLTYHFFSVLPLTGMAVKAEADVPGPVELSTDGLTFRAADATDGEWQGRNLWVRLALRPGSTLRGWSLTGKVVAPAERAIPLTPIRGACVYEDGFDAPRYLQLAEIDHPDRLIAARGGVSIRGMAGAANRVEIKQRFTCDRPLEGVRIELTSQAWERDLSAHNELGVSLDGASLIASDTTLGKAAASGRYDGTLTIDLSADERVRGAREFWVHMVMVNRSGVRTNPSSTLRNLRVEATVRKEG